MRAEVPEPWAAAMIAAGFVDSRYKSDIPSMRRLADAAGTTTSTISAMIAGTRDTDGAIVQRVAEALGLSESAGEVERWVGHSRTANKPFVPHRDANLLTSDEQAAVNELIRLMALPKKRGGGDADLVPGTPPAAPSPTGRGGLSVVPPSVDEVVAADQDEDPDLAAGEALEPEHP